jgi:hypothetical protein
MELCRAAYTVHRISLEYYNKVYTALEFNITAEHHREELHMYMIFGSYLFIQLYSILYVL